MAELENVLKLIEQASKENVINLDDLANQIDQQRKALPVEAPQGEINGFDARLRSEDENSVLAASRRTPYGVLDGVGASGPGGMFWTLGPQQYKKKIPSWSIYPNYRDGKLMDLWMNEPLMAGTVYSMGSRIKSLDWNIEGPLKRTNKYFKKLFDDAEFGAGYGDLIFKTCTSINTTDNGAFFEISGPGHLLGARKGLPTAIHHMDSLLCWRTFDREYPVIYINPIYNTYHLMHKTRVMSISSMPMPVELARGVGFCAVSRALMLLDYIQAVQIYKHEKVTGKFTRAIGWGEGITKGQFEGGLSDAQIDSMNKGYSVYKGIPFIFSMKEGAKLNLLDMASLPDGFDFDQELVDVMSAYANAFGVDIREIWALAGPGASKADAAIQHLKARGKGYADILQTLEKAFVKNIFPEDSETKLVHDYTDPEQDKVANENDGLVIDNLGKLQTQGIFDADECRAIYIDKGGVNVNLLKTDAQREADKTAKQEEQMKLAQQNQPLQTNQPSVKPGEKKPEAKPLATPDHTQPRKTFMPNDPAKKQLDDELTDEEIESVYKEYEGLIRGR
jgi:hypothetical protein